MEPSNIDISKPAPGAEHLSLNTARSYSSSLGPGTHKHTCLVVSNSVTGRGKNCVVSHKAFSLNREAVTAHSLWQSYHSEAVSLTVTISIQGYQCMCGSWNTQKGHCGRVGGSWLGPALNETPCLSCGVALEPSSYSRYNEDWRGVKSFGDLLCPGTMH